MSRPKSESGPVLNWSSPDQNSDFGWPRSEFSSELDQFRTGPANIRILILIWALTYVSGEDTYWSELTIMSILVSL